MKHADGRKRQIPRRVHFTHLVRRTRKIRHEMFITHTDVIKITTE